MEENKKSAANIASLVLGIISVLTTFFWYVTFPSGILAIILGAKGYNKQKSKIALAGMIVGIVGTSLATLIYAIMICIIVISF